MRNLSCTLTVAQVLARLKTVSRRMGWENLKAGELLCLVEKGQGLKKGEQVRRLAVVRVVDARREKLSRMTDDLPYGFQECRLEGFEKDRVLCWPTEFIDFFCRSHKGCSPDTTITRIEWEYVEVEWRE